MSRPKRGVDGPLNPSPDVSRPPGFPIKTGPIVFGQVYPCSRCGGKGTFREDTKDKSCPRCYGTGWHKREEIPHVDG